MELDTSNDKGVSKRRSLEKVFKQTGIMPEELEEEVFPEYWDEPLFTAFFDIYQRGKEFYQTIYYYQKIMDLNFDGEDLALLSKMWTYAEKYFADKDKKKTPKSKTKERPNSKQIGR